METLCIAVDNGGCEEKGCRLYAEAGETVNVMRVAVAEVAHQPRDGSVELAEFAVRTYQTATSGRPQDSELLLRMQLRGPGQMPNLATFVMDEVAAERVADWIERVSPGRY